MGGKKGKKGKGQEDEDNPTENFLVEWKSSFCSNFSSFSFDSDAW